MKTHILLIILISFLTNGFANSAESTKLNNVQLNASAIIQKQKLIEEGITGESLSNDGFGTSVDIQGDIAVIGIPNYNGVGEVRIYEFDGSDWIQSQVLKPTDTEGHNGYYGGFGIKLILDNNRLAILSRPGVGYSGRIISTFSFNGGIWKYEDSIYNDGNLFWDEFSFKNDTLVVYSSTWHIFLVYDFIENNWKLTHTEKLNIDQSIYSLVFENDMIVIGDSSRSEGDNSGAVYIYEKTNGNWQQSHTIKPTDNQPFKYFGQTIDLLNNRLAISSPGNNSDRGSVYIFDYINNSWQQSDKITKQFTINFSSKIVLNNDSLIVSGKQSGNYSANYYNFENQTWNLKFSIPLVSTYSSGYNTNISSLGLSNSKIIIGEPFSTDTTTGGEAFIYSHNNQVWELEKHFQREPSNASLSFGALIDIHENKAIIGASIYNYDGAKWNISQELIPSEVNNFSFNNVSIHNNRAILTSESLRKVFTFELNNGVWGETETLSNEDSNVGSFGLNAQIYGDRIIVSGYNWGTENYIYIYEHNGLNWIHTETLPIPLSSLMSHGYFDFSLFEDRVIVTTKSESIDNSILVYDFDGLDWNHSATLISNDIEGFGLNVSLHENIAVVQSESSGTLESKIPSVSVFQYNGLNWHQITTLKFPSDNFYSYSNSNVMQLESNNHSVIARYYPPGTTYGGYHPEHVYYFKFDGNSFQRYHVVPDDGYIDDRFGWAVSLSENQFFVSAIYDDDNGNATGSVYNFEFNDVIFNNSFESL